MATGNFRNDVGQLADAVVFGGLADVKGLVVNRFARRFQHCDHGGNDVADVHDRPPGRAVTLDVHAASGIGRRHQVIQHNVQTQAGRNSVGGGIAHICWREMLAGQRSDVAFD